MDRCYPVTKSLPAACAWIIFLSATGIFFAFPCRYLMTIYSMAIPVAQAIVTFFVVMNFALTTFVNPGVIPRALPEETKRDTPLTSTPGPLEIEIQGTRVRLKWCGTCQFHRPPRCVHCGVCDNCVESFDHHCPWVNNCVGRRNYRYFFMFLFWLSVHVMSILAWCILYIKDHIEDLRDLDAFMTLAVIVVAIIFFIPIIGLTGYHFALVIQGKTTNEQVTGKFQDERNPYTRGCCRNIIYSLCTSPVPNYRPRRCRHSLFNMEQKKGYSKHQPVSETEKVLLSNSSDMTGPLKFVDEVDLSGQRASSSSSAGYESPAPYLDRDSFHPKRASAARGRALTPPVPVRFDCSRRSLPPHNRLQQQPPPPLVFHTPQTYPPPHFAAEAGSFPSEASDRCCLGNPTVDKLQEVANRAIAGGQCSDILVLEAFPKGCSQFYSSPQRMERIGIHNSCQIDASGHLCHNHDLLRTRGNRPLSFVKAMEMSESSDFFQDPHPEDGKRDVGYEISV